MPQKLWAVSEEVLAADFNPYLQNQVVPQFTNVAQRDAQWPAPPNGAVCVTVDTGRLWQRIGGVWFQPFTVLGSAQIVSNTGAVSAETAMGVNVTVTLPAGRRIRLEAMVRGVNLSVTSAAGFVRIKEGAAQFQETQFAASPSLASSGAFIAATIAPSGGVHTYGLYLAAVGGTAYVTAGGGFPCTLDVIDMGAA